MVMQRLLEGTENLHNIEEMVEIITRTQCCSAIVKDLNKEDFIAVDSEGISLGKDGPLTLLQVGTTKGKVYLFDVMENRSMFDEGGLKDLLQSNDVVKVIHSCKGDSAALYHQYNVHLRNVFDTQIAHLVIEEHKGRKLPRSLKLADLCAVYSDNATVSDEKDTVKVKFVREVGNYWAIRPLTEEMIDYASKDATALIPDVYLQQKLYLEANGLSEKYRDRVHEEINHSIDKQARLKKESREDKVIKSVLANFPTKYNSMTKFSDITDEDDVRAIQMVRVDTDGLSSLVTRLKTESIKANLQDLDDQLSEEGDKFLPKSKSFAYLRRYKNHPDDTIKRDATRILKSIDGKVLEIMTYKYNRSTKLGYLSPYERDALKIIRPKGENDPKFHQTILYLYWLVKEADLDRTISMFEEQGRSYQITEGFYKWIRFCCSDQVPASMKQKAKAHLRKMDSQFGRGKVPTGSS